MFKLSWGEDNFLVLSPSGVHDDYFPVFAEELIILGLDKYFDFPTNTRSPLLWGKDIGSYILYYKNGEVVAKIKKGALFREHKIMEVKKDVFLEPVNLEKLCELNYKYISDLINEALDYIYQEKKRFKKKGYTFAISYSGGKDSQVVLDLVLQVIPPDGLSIIFTDTKMELPDTYYMVEWTEKFYGKLYPNFKIHKVGSVFDTLELWELIGPPSRIKRWCCNVYKIAPQIRFLSNFIPNSNNKTLVVFEGTRAEESPIRGCFSRTSLREKTFREINIRPVFRWSTFEIFLYHFLRGLEINPLYKKGFRRVGCSVCPFSSSWSEYLIWKLYPFYTQKYLSILEKFARNMGVINEEEMKEYISSGAWKVRAGGLGLESNTWVEVVRNGSELKAVIENGREKITEWIKTVGKVHILDEKENHTIGELRVGKAIIHFMIKKEGNKQFVVFKNVDPHPVIYKKLENVLYKSAYCLHCTSCEIECPHNALITYPEVKVNSILCSHCGNCLEFVDKGCYVAESSNMFLQKKLKRGETMRIDRYNTFGLRRNWLENFLEKGKDWLIDNTLGPKQKDAISKYLLDAELIDNKKNLTDSFKFLSQLFTKDLKSVWQIVWINLCINSDLFNWYVTEIPWGRSWKKDELVTLLKEKGAAERTARNAINALTNTFESSPLGEWFGKKENKVYWTYNPN